MKKLVFLSCISLETGWARWANHFAERLSALGIHLSVEAREIELGEPGQGTIPHALRNSEAVVAVVSKSSIGSPSLNMEIGAAFAARKTIILVAPDGLAYENLPASLSHHQYVFEKSAAEAAKEVARLLVQEDPHFASRRPRTVVSDYDSESTKGLGDHEWSAILDAIECDLCVPFLGAGICAGSLPTASRLAFDLATETEYPLPDCDDLARVSQYVAVRSSPSIVKRRVLEMLGLRSNEETHVTANRATSDDPHEVLAQLPLKLYLTTNYDDFMFKALQRCGRDAIREHCRWYCDWHERTNGSPQEPLSVARPTVFHLHGSNDAPDSIVLTEDDYLDFLVNMSQDLNIVPPAIQGAIANSSLLFIGYGLRDWNFRILHRALLSQVLETQRWPSFAVQLTPFEYQPGCIATVYMKNGNRMTGEVTAGTTNRLVLKERTVGTIEIPRESVLHVQVVDPRNQPLAAFNEVKDYLQQYFSQINIRIYWGTAEQFVSELWTRWNSRRKENPASRQEPQSGDQ